MVRLAFVDDEKEYTMEMERICREFGVENHCGIETFSFTDAAVFLDAFREGGFDMVFMDIYIDGMGGGSAAARVGEGGKNLFLGFFPSSGVFLAEGFSWHAL